MNVSLDILLIRERASRVIASFTSLLTVASGCERKTCMIFDEKHFLRSLFDSICCAQRRCSCPYVGRLAMVLSEFHQCSCLPVWRLLSQKRNVSPLVGAGSFSVFQGSHLLTHRQQQVCITPDFQRKKSTA